MRFLISCGLLLFCLCSYANRADSLYHAISSTTDDVQRIKLYRELLEHLMNEEVLDTSTIIFYAQLGIDQSYKSKCEEQLPYFYNTLGYMFKFRKDYDKAQIMIRKGLEIAQKLDNSTDISRSGYTLGIVYLDQQKVGEAISQIQQNFKHLRQFPDDYYSHANYLLMAYLTLSMDNYQLFQYFYEKASRLYEYGESSKRLIYDFKIRDCLLKGKVEEADEVLEKMLLEFPPQSRNRAIEIPEMYLNVADAYIRQGFYKKGVDLLEQVLSVKHGENDYPIYKCMTLLSRGYIQLEKIDLADKWNKIALSKAPNMILMDHRLMALENDVLIKQARGQYTELRGVLLELGKYKDSVNSAKNNKSFLLVSLLQDYDEMEEDFDQVKSLNLEQKELLQRDKRIRILLLVLLGLMAIFTATIYRFYKKLEERKKEIQRKRWELASQAQVLSEANLQKDKLLSLIGHELRSPVAELISILEVKKRINKYESAIDYLDSIYVKSKRVHQTLENILTWSASQLKMQGSATVPIDLGKLVRYTLEFTAESLGEKQLKVNNKVKDVWAMGQEAEMLIVLRNLINNAIKFSPEGGSIHLYSYQESDLLHLVIADEGEGMSESVLSTLFTTIQQSERGTFGEKGTGVGLYICADLMRGIGGDIRARRRPVGGTEMVLIFQAAEH